MQIKIYLVLSLLSLSPTLALAVPTDAQTIQSEEALNDLANSNASSAIRIISLVDNVTVTKFSILSPHSMNVDLKYSGSGSAPSVKVESSVISINSKLANQIPEDIGKLIVNPSVQNNSTNTTTLIDKNLDALGAKILSQANGTAIVDKGWKSPKVVGTKLAGEATLTNPVSVRVVVKP
jgi:hypothetical protein